MSAFDDEPDIFDESDIEEEEIDDEPSEGLTNKNKNKVKQDDEDGIDEDDEDDDVEEIQDDVEGNDDDDDDDEDKNNNDDSNDLNTNNDVNRQQNMFDFNTDSDSDSDEEDGYDYLQKFDENTSKKVLENYYPEHIQHNYDEIEKMTKTCHSEKFWDSFLSFSSY